MPRARRYSRSDHRNLLKKVALKGRLMNRAATLGLVLLACSGAAAAKDLVGVFEDAVHNDPVIRQADANRLAAREARPQAWAAVLPQINGTAQVTRDHSSGFQDQISEVPNPPNPPTLFVFPLP